MPNMACRVPCDLTLAYCPASSLNTLPSALDHSLSCAWTLFLPLIPFCVNSYLTGKFQPRIFPSRNVFRTSKHQVGACFRDSATMSVGPLPLLMMKRSHLLSPVHPHEPAPICSPLGTGQGMDT